MEILKKIVLPILIMLMLFMLLSCIGNAAIKTDQVIIGLNFDLITLDPARAYEPTALPIIHALYDNLMKFEDRTGVSSKNLAESYEISPDGKVFTFKLKSGIKFNSGNNLTSKDVKWSYDRVKNIKSNASFLAQDIDKIETPDEKTVVIYLKKKDGAFLPKLTSSAFAILDSELLKSHGGTADANAAITDKVGGWLDNNSAGSGPYVLERYTPDVEVVLKRNDNYWKEAPAVEKIVFKDLPNPNTQMLMLQEGDIDIAYILNADQIKQIEGKEGVDTKSSSTLTTVYLLTNEDPEIGGPMANKDVQNAVRYALDYKGIQKIVGKGSITPYSLIPIGFLGALPPRDPGYTNIEKAKELLTKAGYPNGFSVTLDTSSLTVEGVKLIDIAVKIKEDLSKVGIDVQINPAEVAILTERERKGELGFSVLYWGIDYVDANNQLVFLPGQPVGLRANWKADANPKLVQLGEAALTETDTTKRVAILEEIQKIMAEDSPWIFLVQPPKHLAFREGLKGVAFSNAYCIEVDKLSW